MSLGGWHVHLDHLADVLDGESVDWPNWNADFLPAWESVRDQYAADPDLHRSA